MSDFLLPILASQSPWSPVFYLISGAILGALISFYFTFKAQRPKLIVSGSGSGGDNQSYRWSITIKNRPTFLGMPFAGESAKDVHPWIRLRDKEASFFPLVWNNQQKQSRITLDPGDNHSIELFSWTAGSSGYFILDAAGEPIARFEARDLSFSLRLNDRLGRTTEIALTVKFDCCRLNSVPQLRIIHPTPFDLRWKMARMAVNEFIRAFGFRR